METGMTTVKFLNGSHEIHGNIASIETKTSRVIIDFGMVGGFKSDTANNLIDSHLLPRLPELFTAQKSAFKYEAIVLTQVNVENLTAAVYLKKNIEIYVSEEGFKLYRSLVQNDLFQPIDLNIKLMPTDLKIGDLLIHGYPSDCGVVGSQVLLISDGKHKFGFVGDVRLNGPHKERVYHWIRRFHQAQLDLLVFDATAYSFSDECRLFETSESGLQVQFSDLLKQRRDLVVVNTDCCNPERLAMIHKTADSLGRKLVCEPSYAEVVAGMYPEIELAVLKSEHKKTTSKKFEVVKVSDLIDHPRRYVLQNSYDQIKFLQNFKAGIYLHSNGFPKISENRDFEFLHDSLKKLNFQYIDFSASSHANKSDVSFIVETIKAKTSVPWHSYHPELAVKSLKQIETKFSLPKRDLPLEFD
jgi:ribonuclease J